MKSHVDQIFQLEKIANIQIEKGEYENCKFIKCDFKNADFSNYIFIDCTFTDCDLSMVKLNNTLLRDVTFLSSKLLGLLFDAANQFGLCVNFNSCVLNNSSFYKVNLKGSGFANCNMKEVDFAEANLMNVVFENCDLEGAIFDNTNMENANFTSSVNYTFDIQKNRVKNSRHSISVGLSLLDRMGLIIN